MSASGPLMISDGNLSHAWGRVLWHIAKTPGRTDIRPLIVTINGFDAHNYPIEDDSIRSALDKFLLDRSEWSVEIVAFTIFPQRYLSLGGGDRSRFYEICFDALPHLKARNPQLNGRGFYFERMMKFGRGRITENQLEFIIAEYLAGRPRASKFQASIFDPERDQSRQPYQTFPCLRSVTFVTSDDGLVVNAFYPIQYLVQRGYGNFLGLAHLGAFMAREMRIPLLQINVVAGIEKLDFSKTDIAALATVVGTRVPDLDPMLNGGAAR